MTTLALNNLWTYLQGLSLSQNDREWLANKLILSVEKSESSDERLKTFLSNISGEWEGDGTDLRQSADMVREIETW